MIDWLIAIMLREKGWIQQTRDDWMAGIQVDQLKLANMIKNDKIVQLRIKEKQETDAKKNKCFAITLFMLERVRYP